MSEGRGESQWGRTSSVLAMIANVNRAKKSSRVYKPEDFNPYKEASRTGGAVRVTKETMSEFRESFIGRFERR